MLTLEMISAAVDVFFSLVTLRIDIAIPARAVTAVFSTTSSAACAWQCSMIQHNEHPKSDCSASILTPQMATERPCAPLRQTGLYPYKQSAAAVEC